MILNAFSVLAAFAALLRVALGLVVVFVGVRAIRRRRRAAPGTDENRFYLLVSMSATLLGLALVSWPLLYLVLQSYVPQWPGVMCIQGVTRIGTGSVGAASYLPGLVGFLEVTKPALVFVSGAWLVLHFANRRDRVGALLGRALWALLLCGVWATVDGAAELAYLIIPKQETTLAAGCCAVEPALLSVAGPFRPPLPGSPSAGSHTWLGVAFYSLGAALVVILSVALRRAARGGTPWLVLALAGALVSLPLGVAFLGAVAAPAFLRLPYHRCGYCLISSAPESLVGIGLYVVGAFGVGWACIARWLGTTAAEPAELSLPLLRMARFGYLAALLMMAGRLVIS